MPKERHKTTEAEQKRGDVLSDQIRPFPWGLGPQLGMALLQGHFQTPALHEVPDDLLIRLVLIGWKEGLCSVFPLGIASEDPSDRQRSPPRAIPQRC